MPRLSRSLLTCLTAVAAVAAVTGCGQQGQDRDFGTYTDCASVGRVSTAGDPAGDQRGAGSGSQGDLVSVRLARGGGRLCVEYVTRGQIQAAALFALSLRPAAADRPVIKLEVSLLSAIAPEIILDNGRDPARRDVSGTVGIRDNRMSVVIRRPAFAAAGPDAAAIFDDFRWQARTSVSVGDKRQLTDCAISCS